MKSLVATLAGILSCAALAAADSGRGSRNNHEFIAVFKPQSTVVVKDNPERCPEPHPLFFTMSGKAQSTIGEVEFVQTHCEDAAHTVFVRGDSKFTTTDGDVLQGTYEGRILHSADGKFVIVDGTWKNTGGTGKFTRARGKGVSAGSLDFATGEIIITFTGSL